MHNTSLIHMKLVKNLHSIPAQQTASSPLQNVIHTKPSTQQKSLVCHYLPSSGFLWDIFPSQQIVITPNRSSFLFLPGYLFCFVCFAGFCLFGFWLCFPPTPKHTTMIYAKLLFPGLVPFYRPTLQGNKTCETKYHN